MKKNISHTSRGFTDAIQRSIDGPCRQESHGPGIVELPMKKGGNYTTMHPLGKHRMFLMKDLNVNVGMDNYRCEGIKQYIPGKRLRTVKDLQIYVSSTIRF